MTPLAILTRETDDGTILLKFTAVFSAIGELLLRVNGRIFGFFLLPLETNLHDREKIGRPADCCVEVDAHRA